MFACVLAAAACMAPAVLAADGAPAEFLLTVRQGDTLIAIAERYLADPAAWPQLRRLNRIADPKRLVPGSSLRIPVDLLRPEAGRAEVVAVSGTATLAGMPLTAGNLLEPGAALRTGPDGFVTLRLPDGSLVSLQPSSEARIGTLSRFANTDIFSTVVRMVSGRIEALVNRLRGVSRFEVQTDIAVAGVRGTRFRVAAAANTGKASAQTEVLEGTVGFGATTAGGSADPVLVGAGFGSVTNDAGRPQAPSALLPAPQVQAADALQERLVTRFRFPAIAGAAKYRAQIAADAQFRQGIAEAQFSSPEIKFADLADGEYYLRARSINQAGLEGPDSEFRFRLKARPEPPLPLAPAPNGRVRATSAALSWATNPAASAYAVQVAEDEGFARVVQEVELTGSQIETLSLPFGEYFWRLRSIRGNAGVVDPGPWGDVRKFSLRPPPKSPEPPEESAAGLNFAWAAEPGQSFLFQLARDGEFNQIITERRLDAPKLTLQRPVAGIYFVRVRATDSDGFVGPFSAPQRFTVINRVIDGTGSSLITTDGNPVRVQ